MAKTKVKRVATKRKEVKKKAPTARQIKAAKAISENIRNKGKTKPLGEILKDAGYSEETSKKPKLVTESLGFKELIDKYLPEDLVSKVHGETLLLAKHSSYKMDAILTDKEIEDIVISVPGCRLIRVKRGKGEPWVTAYYYEPDGANRLKAIDMAYKLRNSYPKDKEETDTNLAIKEYLDKLSKILP